jgi:RNA-binding protein
MPLSGKQERYLRGLGHALKPIMLIGQQGIDVRVITAITDALAAHELVKIKLLESYTGDRHAAADMLADKTGAELVQVLGRTILLYKKSAKAPGILLPE